MERLGITPFDSFKSIKIFWFICIQYVRSVILIINFFSVCTLFQWQWEGNIQLEIFSVHHGEIFWDDRYKVQTTSNAQHFQPMEHFNY